MSGISYDLKKIKGIVFDVDGVLSPSVIPIDEDGKPVRMMNVKDGYALLVAINNGMRIAIITGGAADRIKKRFESLGIHDIHGNVADKLPVMKQWMEQNALHPEEVAYMGDDIPDLKCMRSVGLPCAPHDASVEALSTASYISPFNGGYGCVRDILNQILRAKGQWMASEKDFIW
ncbi:HAD hydrolase-like protein [bacterium]|nr:HAD hydrolase-like protein [Bacteroides sp.]MBD5387009.1 HAD hydrolase-like protein [bacterium]